MNIASRATPMVAGILGGSDSHVVQIVIGIWVVILLVVALFVWRRSSAGGRVRYVGPGTSAAPAETTTGEGQPTLRLTRAWSGLGFGSGESWSIAIDGNEVGTLANQETVEISLPAGHHTLRLGSGRHVSPPRPFDVAGDEVVSFSCHGPRLWPVFVAALVKPDLWISLRRA